MNMTNQGTTICDDGRYDRPFLFGHGAMGPGDFGFMSVPIREFIRVVQAGDQPPISLDDGLENVRILAAAMESIATGQVVELVG